MESSGEGLSSDKTPIDADVAAAAAAIVVVAVVVESAAAAAAAGEEVKLAPPPPPPDELKRHIILLNDLEAGMLKIGIKIPFQSAGKSKPAHACFGHNEQRNL